MSYLPPPTPKQRAERRASMINTILWLAAVPFLVFAAMAFGYSDQAPAWLREGTIWLDAQFGQPVWNAIRPK